MQNNGEDGEQPIDVGLRIQRFTVFRAVWCVRAGAGGGGVRVNTVICTASLPLCKLCVV